ncbi:MAG: SMI1/KNR4 family protein [Planctomycetota bacterium]|nr:MAG: SMI1/KNR4 family protein [Planctomycetota bacterium]
MSDEGATADAAPAPSPHDELFAAFEEAAREGDPEWNPPADGAALDAAERALGVRLPAAYKAFLQRHNGGLVFDTTLYGVGCEDEGSDLVVLNERGREEGLPAHLVGFAATLTGDVYCFNTDEGEGDDHPVSLIDIEEGQVIPACENFAEWLERLPVLEQQLAEARGPQPMTVEEWEEFLRRERAKLRKLSQTPARELRMPDPEQVRADLGGKIPVDPRHLKPRS